MHRTDHSRFRKRHDFVPDFSHAERRTPIVIGITAAMMVLEIVVGLMSNSMALLADGWSFVATLPNGLPRDTETANLGQHVQQLIGERLESVAFASQQDEAATLGSKALGQLPSDAR